MKIALLTRPQGTQPTRRIDKLTNLSLNPVPTTFPLHPHIDHS